MVLLRTVWRGWLALGAVLGWVNTRILLLVVFFLILTPLALARRVGRRPAHDGWHERAPSVGRERLRRPH